MEPPISMNSAESHERHSANLQKYDENYLNPVSIFNDDFDESLPANSDPLIDNLFEDSAEDHGNKIVNDLMSQLLFEVRSNLFPQRSDEGTPVENADLLFPAANDTNNIIRVGEIECKTIDREEIDRTIITKYCEEIKNMIKMMPNFLSKFYTPITEDSMEYMRNLRFYGLQKTEEGTDYTMMQD